MSKKRKGLVSVVRKIAKTKESLGFKKNPPIVTDLMTYVAPGAGAYVATHVAGRAAQAFLGPKFPKMLPYLAPAGNLAAFGLIWYLSHKVNKAKKYHNQLMIGSGIALIQSLVTTLMPKLAWLVGSAGAVALPAAPAAKATGDDSDDLEADLGADDMEADLGDDLDDDLRQGVFAE